MTVLFNIAVSINGQLPNPTGLSVFLSPASQGPTGGETAGDSVAPSTVGLLEQLCDSEAVNDPL